MQVELKTNLGLIVIELVPEHAPKTVENFLDLVNSGYYNGLIFHRVISGFMIQGGGFEPSMKQKPQGQKIVNENSAEGLKNDRYTVAMARTNDPHSASNQFFINTVDNDFLNFKSQSPHGWGYCVFGRVIEGRDVVDRIEKVKTARSGFHDDVPVDLIVIETATVRG
jgi:peptidyl-prolyl cis-trans isomerase B (cyclophilin B)